MYGLSTSHPKMLLMCICSQAIVSTPILLSRRLCRHFMMSLRLGGFDTSAWVLAMLINVRYPVVDHASIALIRTPQPSPCYAEWVKYLKYLTMCFFEHQSQTMLSLINWLHSSQCKTTTIWHTERKSERCSLPWRYHKTSAIYYGIWHGKLI